VTTRLRAAAAVVFAVVVGPAAVARAHPVDAATVLLSEVAPGRFLLRWQAGSAALMSDLASPIVPPKPCRLDGPYVDCGPRGLVGTVTLPWLEGTLTRVMVDITWLNGARLLRIVTPSAPRLNVYGPALGGGGGAGGGLALVEPIAADYTALGVEHILTGFDHLLFVIALTFLVPLGRRLLATVTAFTVAHSLSLAATVFGVVTLPGPPVEASIALSIVLVCAECLRPGESLTRRAPWLVAFAFGLLHGLGFASALLAIGLPPAHVPLALLFFNVGVELGQLGTIAVVTALGLVIARAGLGRPWMRPGIIYAMGSVAAAWSLERVAAVLAP